jgi:predicted TIM-barrel fold metal-dependent hydrolase
MLDLAIIDALFCIPKDVRTTQLSDCKRFSEDLTPQLNGGGMVGAVIAPCLCRQCQNQWNCADRKTQEVTETVRRNPNQLRGLGSYDALRIGDSLRWIDEGVTTGTLAGAYAQADYCVSGLDSRRMYPLYGLCAKLRAPIVMDFNTRECWQHHRPQVEVIAADFPDLKIVLATPPRTEAGSILRLLQRFPHAAFLLNPKDLQADAALCEYMELQGCDRVMFRAHPLSWESAAETAMGMPLGEEAKRAYVGGNAAKLFGFAALANSLQNAG